MTVSSVGTFVHIKPISVVELKLTRMLVGASGPRKVSKCAKIRNYRIRSRSGKYTITRGSTANVINIFIHYFVFKYYVLIKCLKEGILGTFRLLFLIR